MKSSLHEESGMSFAKELRCRECGGGFPISPRAICDECFGPLEVSYDYDGLGRRLNPATVAARPRSMWRYRELLPVDGDSILGQEVGYTPLVRATRLAA